MSTDNKKYELIDEPKYIIKKQRTKKRIRRQLYRIRALKDFGDVKAGDLGGFVRSEDNLSQKGNCWVYDDSIVTDEAEIHNDAIIKNNSYIYGHAVVSDYAIINNSCVSDHAFVFGKACILEDSSVFGNAIISGNTHVYEKSAVLGHVQVYDDTLIYGGSTVQGSAKIHGKSRIYGGIIASNVGEVEDGEIYDNETMNKYILLHLRKEVLEFMEKENPVLSNNVEIKNMNDMAKDNYGSLNKVLEALYGQGPYTAYQVEYAMDVYKNRNTSSEDEESNDNQSTTIQVYIDIVSRGTASIELNPYQYYSYDIDDICKRVQNMFNKKELCIDWADGAEAKLKVLDTKTGEWSNTVSFDPNHSNNN